MICAAPAPITPGRVQPGIGTGRSIAPVAMIKWRARIVFGGAAARQMDRAIAIDLPDRRIGAIVDPAVLASHGELPGQRRALPIVGAENVVEFRFVGAVA